MSPLTSEWASIFGGERVFKKTALAAALMARSNLTSSSFALAVTVSFVQRNSFQLFEGRGEAKGTQEIESGDNNRTSRKSTSLREFTKAKMIRFESRYVVDNDELNSFRQFINDASPTVVTVLTFFLA